MKKNISAVLLISLLTLHSAKSAESDPPSISLGSVKAIVSLDEPAAGGFFSWSGLSRVIENTKAAYESWMGHSVDKPQAPVRSPSRKVRKRVQGSLCTRLMAGLVMVTRATADKDVLLYPTTNDTDAIRGDLLRYEGYPLQRLSNNDVWIVRFPDHVRDDHIARLTTVMAEPSRPLSDISSLFAQAWRDVETRAPVMPRYETMGSHPHHHIHRDLSYREFTPQERERLNYMNLSVLAKSPTLKGNISIALVFVQGRTSPQGGTSYIFDVKDMRDVMNGCMNGIKEIQRQAPSSSKFSLNWSIFTPSVVANPDINDPWPLNNWEAAWRDPALSYLGYQTGWDGVLQFVTKIKGANDYSAISWFVKYPIPIASGGAISRYTEQETVINFPPRSFHSLDKLYAEEFVHLFGAQDEYTDPPTPCTCNINSFDTYPIINGNCGFCFFNPSSRVPCLFRSDDSTFDLCRFTKGQIGWGWWSEEGNVVTPLSSPLGLPALTFFNNEIYSFSCASDGHYNIFMSKSSDGKIWSSPIVIKPYGWSFATSCQGQIASASAFGNIYVAFIGSEAVYNLYVTHSSNPTNPDPFSWSGAQNLGTFGLSNPPLSMTFFNNNLYLGYVSLSGLIDIYYSSSANDWNYYRISNTPRVLYPPAFTVFNNKLYMLIQPYNEIKEGSSNHTVVSDRAIKSRRLQTLTARLCSTDQPSSNTWVCSDLDFQTRAQPGITTHIKNSELYLTWRDYPSGNTKILSSLDGVYFNVSYFPDLTIPIGTGSEPSGARMISQYLIDDNAILMAVKGAYKGGASDTIHYLRAAGNF